MTLVFLHIDHASGVRELQLGDFETAYKTEITIGGIAGSMVMVPLDGIQVRIAARSNHRMMQVVAAPASSPLFAEIGQWQRVDRRPFSLGDYTICIREISVEILIGGLAKDTEHIAYLRYFGAEARRAIPRLLCNVIEATATHDASRAELARLGVSLELGAEHALVASSADPDPSVRKQAIRVLGARGVRALEPRLADPVLDVRAAAAIAYWELTREPARVVAALATVFAEGDLDVVREGARTLAEVGAVALPALAGLQQAFGRDVARSEVGKALAAIGAPAIPFLAAAIDDPDSYVRRDTVGAFGKFAATHADAVVPILVRQLDREADPVVISWILDALGNFGAGARDAIPAIVTMRDRHADDTFVPRSATRALALITGSP